MIEFFVISLTSSSDISFSLSKEDILLNSRLNSPKEIFFPLTFKGELDGADGSDKKPPKVATNPKINIATIIDDPVDDNPFLMF